MPALRAVQTLDAALTEARRADFSPGLLGVQQSAEFYFEGCGKVLTELPSAGVPMATDGITVDSHRGGCLLPCMALGLVFDGLSFPWLQDFEGIGSTQEFLHFHADLPLSLTARGGGVWDFRKNPA